MQTAQTRHPVTVRDGLKPRRGGLFIANERPQIILFVFRRRGFCTDNAHLEYQYSTCFRGARVHGAALPKNKKKRNDLRILPINRPPLRGFGSGADNSEPNTSASKMWVMTRLRSARVPLGRVPRTARAVVAKADQRNAPKAELGAPLAAGNLLAALRLFQ